MSPLALDQRQRDPFVQQLDGVEWRSRCGAKRRRTAASAATRVSAIRAAPADQACPRVGPTITQNTGPMGSLAGAANHRVSADYAQASMPTSRTVVLAVLCRGAGYAELLLTVRAL
jgi:hypothetical protein